MADIFSVGVHPDDVNLTVASWAVATITANKEFNSICIVVKDDEKLHQIKEKILSMLRWLKHEDIIHYRASNRITIGDYSSIEIVVGIDKYPPGRTFTKLFLVNFNDKEMEDTTRLLTPAFITKNTHNIIGINSWD